MPNEESSAPTDERFPPAPRKVEVRAGPLVGVALIFLCLLPFCGYGTYFVAADSMNTVLLRRHGVDAVAKVLEMGQTTGKGTHYWARFAYEFRGNSYESKDNIDRKDYTALNRGDTIPILLDPTNAGHSKANIDGVARNPDPILYFVGILTLAMLGFGITIIVVMIQTAYQYSRESRLLRSGIPVKGTITAKEEYRVKTDLRLKITYSFPTPFGGVHHGERSNLSVDEPDIFLEDPVVFYDPARPEVNAFYPMERVKLAGEP